jgi:glycosyltransferase involved in cell wall biosynthesis
VRLADLQLDSSVHLSGYVNDIRPMIASAAVCIVPLRQGGGTRLKILEAMALGTPVVATSKGAEGLDATPGRDILIADDATEFANQVVRVMRDATLRAEVASNARRLVEHRYDWQQIGGRFVDLVEAAASRRSVGPA